MRTQIRIVAGLLRGRKITCEVGPHLRPTPQMVREALFSILGDAVPGRPFFDVFAGTGIIGIEALSRGASLASFVERDFRLIEGLDRHLKLFKLDNARILRADVYRWVERWQPPPEPINVFLSPPYPDLERRPDDMLTMIGLIQEKIAPESVLTLQSEKVPMLDKLPDRDNWDERKYGRNHLLFWVKETEAKTEPAQGTEVPPPMSPREFAIKVVRTLRQAGHEALWAGGCVRDEFLGLIPKDYDVATSARPEQVQELFPRTIAVGAAFGVIEVLERGRLNVQVATFRSDGAYIDGRRPETVIFSSPQEDAQRRDFTINGMFFDPLENRLIDYVGGQVDLEARVLRAIGNPLERFREDRLRILRGVRLAARFGLTIDPTTHTAMKQMAPELGHGVSAERIAEEMRKILVDRNRARGMRLFMETGLAHVVLPEIVPMRGLPHGLPRADGPGLPPPGQPGSAECDLWDHVLHVLDLLGDHPSFPLAMSALLHDIGKPRTVGRTPDRYTFYGHEHVGKRMAGEIADRLRFSNEERERIEWLVEKHQILAEARRMRPAKLKMLLVHRGIHELFDLHRADAIASSKGCDPIDYAERMLHEWAEKGELAPPPLLTGNDLLDLGLPQGPIFRTLLDRVRESQLDGSIHNREDALSLVQQLLAGKQPSD